MCDFILGAETGHLLAGKVRSIVRDVVGESEAAHYFLPEKLDNLLPGEFRKWHRLDLFGEVASGYQ